MAVFVLSGLWHGAAAGYFWWGALCGALVLLEKLPATLRKAARGQSARRAAEPQRTARHHSGSSSDGMPPFAKAVGRFALRWARRALTFAELAFTFIFFSAALYKASPDLHPYLTLLSGWTAEGWAALQKGLAAAKLLDDPQQWVVWGGTLFALALESRGNVGEWVRRRWFFIRWPLYALLVAGLVFFGVFGNSAFIYQQY